MMLTRRYTQARIRIRDIAYEENLPEKFLELILLELKNARIVESVRGAKGGYRLRRAPSEIRLSEIVVLIDGPLAPFGDAGQLRILIDRCGPPRLYKVFLRCGMQRPGSSIQTTLADLISRGLRLIRVQRFLAGIRRLPPEEKGESGRCDRGARQGL